MASSEAEKRKLGSSPESEDKAGADSGQDNPEKTGRFQKKVFVPRYEPIQTRKRTKLSHDTTPSPGPEAGGSQPRKREHGRKVTRTRLTKDEVFTPDVGPRPKAVPKSLLILEPGLLPRTGKKKQLQLASSEQTPTSAAVSKEASVSWTLSSQADPQPQTVTVISSSAADGTTPLVVSSTPLVLESGGEGGGNLGDRKEGEVGVSQSENGAASYIFTAVSGDEDGSELIAVTEGEVVEKVTDATGHTLSYTVISQPGSGECMEERSDTPTSLLLLAEAAYPSSTEPPPSSMTSVTQSLPSMLQGSNAGDNLTGKVGGPSNTSPITSSPTFMTVTCQKDSAATVLTSSCEGQIPSLTSTLPANQIPSLTPTLPASQTPCLTSSSLPANPWTCSVCGELMSEGERERHLTQHLDRVEEEDFICETCGEQLKDEEDLELHMAVEHDVEEDDLDHAEGMDDFEEDEDEEEDDRRQTEAGRVEPMTTAAVASVGNGVLTTTGGNPVYTCDQCGETFAYAAYLRRHVKSVHADVGAIFPCTMCPRSFTSESALEMHSCLHQKPGISFKCIRCSQSFSSASLLSTHARSCLRVAIHMPSIISKRGRGRGRGQGQGRGRAGDHACSMCSKTFTSEVYLQAHQLSHQTGPDSTDTPRRKQGLQCLYCAERFQHLGPLKEHMLALHPNAFPFKCTVCQRGFSRDSSRIAHQHTHQTLKLHFCPQCGEGFTLQTYLNRHMKYRHLKPVKFPCSVCQKEFVRQADLIKHMRVHTGEKPYVCEQCGHGFSQQSNYRYHMMRHRGEKPHVCPMCNKGFRVPSHLKMHMQQHLNERFTCHHCRKVFSQSRYLNRHLRTHAKGKQVSGGGEPIVPAATVTAPDALETVVVYETPPPTSSSKTEQQVIVEAVPDDVSEQVVVVQDADCEGGSVIQLVMQDKVAPPQGQGQGQPKDFTAVVDGEESAAVCTTVTITSENTADNVVVSESCPPGVGVVGEEQAYVNTDEGARVVVGAFTEGEGGSMEDGNVTLPFRSLTQILGGRHYKCEACGDSFSISPAATYNMIHTASSHILVINLNHHHHHGSAATS